MENPSIHSELLFLQSHFPIVPLNAGLLISNGTGKHDIRVIDSYELILVKSGNLVLFEEDRVFNLRENQTLILWPDRLHGGIEPFPPDLSFYWVHFRISGGSDANDTQCLTVPRVATLQNPDRITEFFLRFIDDQETGRLTSFDANLLILLMLSEIQSASTVSRKEEQENRCLIERVESYIATHYHQNISTSSLAKELVYNPDYLGRIFHKVRGYPITKAIHRRRIKEAKTLLIQNYMNIEEIAVACGYRDAGYFRKVFKKMIGMCPHRFRELYSHVHINSH